MRLDDQEVNKIEKIKYVKEIRIYKSTILIELRIFSHTMTKESIDILPSITLKTL